MLVAKIMNYSSIEKISILNYIRSVIQVAIGVFSAMEILIGKPEHPVMFLLVIFT